MFPFTLDAMHKANVDLTKAFIDLKMVGYKSYADALNSYTSGFFKRQLEDSKVAVETLGDNMKKAVAFGIK